MIFKLVEKLDRVFHFQPAQAHCDIPCGIYDPHRAIIGALTVIRMVDLMDEMKSTHQPDEPTYVNNLPRYVLVKEEHAEIVKHETRILFGDYFKQEHIDKYPELPQLVHKIYQLAGKARQNWDRAGALQLLEAVNRLAEIFWETKGLATHRAKAPYKPGEEIVVANL